MIVPKSIDQIDPLPLPPLQRVLTDADALADLRGTPRPPPTYVPAPPSSKS